MARGITQEQVHAAADALLAAGERPTVERVRAHLGTGSPNTVTRLLEGWWQTLGERIHAQQRRMAIPDAPEGVQSLAAQLWAAALEAGTTQARGELAVARAACTSAVSEAQRLQDEALASAEAARADAAAVSAERDQVLTRVKDLERLADLQASQLREAQLLSLQTREALAGAQVETAALRERLEAARLEAADMQTAQAAHLRQLEDRAHAEIDAARQQVRELRRETTRAQAQSRRTEDDLRKSLESARQAASIAEREAAAQRARADALEQQLAALGNRPGEGRVPLGDSSGRRGSRMTRVTKVTKKPAPVARPRAARAKDVSK